MNVEFLGYLESTRSAPAKEFLLELVQQTLDDKPARVMLERFQSDQDVYTLLDSYESKESAS
jgi:hypothetical protein